MIQLCKKNLLIYSTNSISILSHSQFQFCQDFRILLSTKMGQGTFRIPKKVRWPGWLFLPRCTFPPFSSPEESISRIWERMPLVLPPHLSSCPWILFEPWPKSSPLFGACDFGNKHQKDFPSISLPHGNNSMELIGVRFGEVPSYRREKYQDKNCLISQTNDLVISTGLQRS